MWTRGELKIRAKKNMKRHYWPLVLVAFILSVAVGEYRTSLTIGNQAIQSQLSGDAETVYGVLTGSNSAIIDSIFGADYRVSISENPHVNRMAQLIIGYVKEGFDGISRTYTFIFNIWGTIKESLDRFQELENTVLVAAAVISILLPILIGYPILVGGRRYYLDICDEREHVGMKVLFSSFHWKMYWRIVKVMFFRWFYSFLWAFTIVGGVVKFYEYRLIPYIMADNPMMPKRQAFALTKNLMRGNKWSIFLLDCSFLGWVIGSCFTMGLLSLFYAAPYRSLVYTDFYRSVRDEAVQKNERLYEILTDPTMEKVAFWGGFR